MGVQADVRTRGSSVVFGVSNCSGTAAPHPARPTLAPWLPATTRPQVERPQGRGGYPYIRAASTHPQLWQHLTSDPPGTRRSGRRCVDEALIEHRQATWQHITSRPSKTETWGEADTRGQANLALHGQGTWRKAAEVGGVARRTWSTASGLPEERSCPRRARTALTAASACSLWPRAVLRACIVSFRLFIARCCSFIGAAKILHTRARAAVSHTQHQLAAAARHQRCGAAVDPAAL